MGLIILAFLTLYGFGMWKLNRWNQYNQEIYEQHCDPDKEASAFSASSFVNTKIY
jgi:hypothetical protein